MEYFGEQIPLEDINVLSVRKYRDQRLAEGVTNATVNIGPAWGDSAQVCVRQTDPLPLTVVSLTAEVAFGG